MAWQDTRSSAGLRRLSRAGAEGRAGWGKQGKTQKAIELRAMDKSKQNAIHKPKFAIVIIYNWPFINLSSNYINII